ncbi:MAG: hypothetical protein ACOYN5_10310 [Bacteroidales bacterium]
MKKIRFTGQQFENQSYHLIILSGLILLGIFDSCQKPVEVQTLRCNLETAKLKFTEDSLQVLYRLETAGDFEVKSFYYQGEQGKITINNPDTLVEILIMLSSQKEMFAGATGSARNGGIKVSYKAIGPAGTTYEAMDQCIQNIIEE